MGQGISEVLTFAIGVAISPVPIIAVILMLFSGKARVNGPMFLLGWVIALAVVSATAYALADAGDVATDGTATDTVSWTQIALGALLLVLAARQWRRRPEPGTEAPMPRWMTGIDSFTPGRAFGLGLLLAGVNPKNLILAAGAGAGLAQAGLATSDAVVALLAFVAVASLTIAVPVLYRLLGGDRAKGTLDTLKDWMAEHNAAVMTVLFLVFGVHLIAKGLPPLTG